MRVRTLGVFLHQSASMAQELSVQTTSSRKKTIRMCGFGRKWIGAIISIVSFLLMTPMDVRHGSWKTLTVKLLVCHVRQPSVTVLVDSSMVSTKSSCHGAGERQV